MPRGVRRTSCRVCERDISECGSLSARGKCQDCGIGRMAENVRGLHEHTGPALLRWRRGMAECAGGVLRDDLLDATADRG